MCDDSETVITMSLEKEGDETGLAPTLNKGRIASSIISALSKATHFAQTLAMPGRAGVAYDVRPRISLKRWTIHDRILNERGLSAMVKLAVFFPLLSVLLFHQSIRSTQTIAKDTVNGHMHLAKDAFIALGLDTTRIDEIEKLLEDDFLPAMIHELKENFVKQIDKIELELERKLADLRTGVTQLTVCLLFLLWFTCVTSMEGLVSEMKALRTDIAMQTESSKGSLFPYTGIPDKIPHFIGREEESQAILDHLTAGDTRLVDVWGPPGFGKTSVAINVAHHLRAMEIPTFFTSLRGMTSKGELVSKLFSNFAVPKSKSHHITATDWLIRCLQELQNRHVLILDNADDLMESGDAKLKEEMLRLMEEILNQCSHIKLLFTTRESLDYLSHKLPVHHKRVGALDEVSSVNLVQSLMPDVSPDDCSSIISICGQVPLAMRLMCNIMREENASLDELLEELKRLPLVEVLDNASFSDDARLKRMIDKSFQRLTDQEKRAFVSLAAFPGCFSITDATAVLKTDRPTKKILRSLERKSLIESHVEDTETSFRVHPILRSFVDEKKRTDKEIGKLRFYYLKLIKRFAKAFERFLTDRFFRAFSNYWEKGSLSSLVNDKLFRRVVGVLSKAKRLFHVMWRGKESLFVNRYETAQKEAKKRKNMAAKRNSSDTEETRAQVKTFRHSWSTPQNMKQATNESEGIPLLIVNVDEGKAEERALTLPVAYPRPQLCDDPKDVAVQLQDDLQLEQGSLQNREPDTKDLETSEGQAFTIPSSVQDALLSNSCDVEEIMNRLQEELLKEQSSLEHPDPETTKMIRCLARKAKVSSRLDVVKRLREVTPAGTTGPLLREDLDVSVIPFKQGRQLSVNLCGGDEWMMVAERLGLTPAEIRFLDKRCRNPFEEALTYSRNQRYWNVGQLYDVLVDCGFQRFADFL